MAQGVEFHEDWDRRSFNVASLRREESPRGITGWLIRKHIAKDITSANKILLISAGCIFIVALFLFFSSGEGGGKPTYLEDIPLEERKNIPEDILESLPSRYAK